MNLETVWTILLYGLLSLAVLFVLVVWVVILAATWVTVNKFMTQYKESSALLKQREAEKAEVDRLMREDDIIP